MEGLIDNITDYWLLLLLIFFVGGCWLKIGWRTSSKRLPPGPYSLPVVGWLPFLGKLPHLTLQQLSQRYGDIMYLKLGMVPFVTISSERAAMELFRYHSLDVASKAPSVVGKSLGSGYTGLIFSMYTEEVKLLRKLVNTHLLSATKLKTYEEIRKREQVELVRSILMLADSAKGIQLRRLFNEMNLNIITHMLFGKRFYGADAGPVSESEREEFIELMNEAVCLIGEFNIGDYIPAIRWLDVQGIEKRCSKVMAKVNAYLESMLQDHRRHPRSSSSTGPLPFIDVLLSLDSTCEEISDTTKSTLLFDLLLGAIDTSAVSVEWAFAYLMKHPDKLQRARTELDNVVGKNRLVVESDLESLPYIRAVTKETLRLHPPAPLPVPKVLQAPLELGGYLIPKGVQVHVNFYSINMNEKYWKSPMEFQPERFLEADVDIFGQSFNLLPFGCGRRVCPGAKLGFDTIQIGVAALVQGFEWKVEGVEDPAEMNMDVTFGVVCHKTTPLVVVAKPRLAAHVYV